MTEHQPADGQHSAPPAVDVSENGESVQATPPVPADTSAAPTPDAVRGRSGHSTTAENVPLGVELDGSAHDLLTADAGASPAVAPVSIAIRPSRNARGQWLKGNSGAQTHGLYASLSAALIAEREEFEAASLADDGGHEVPARRRALHRYRARLHAQIECMADALERHGQFDKKGRLRKAWLSTLETLIGAAVRVDGLLGLERRPRDVSTLSASDWLQQHAEPPPSHEAGPSTERLTTGSQEPSPLDREDPHAKE